jgi:hypothetical protein
MAPKRKSLKRALIGSGALLLIFCYGLTLWSNIVWEHSIDPQDTDVIYWNDTAQTVVVWECPIDCRELGRQYELKPDDFKSYTPSHRHEKPQAVLIKSLDGATIGCASIGAYDNRPSWYALVSHAADCSLFEASSTPTIETN